MPSKKPGGDKHKRPKTTTTTTTTVSPYDDFDEDEDEDDEDDEDLDLPDNRIDESHPPVITASTKLPPPWAGESTTNRYDDDDDDDDVNAFGVDVSILGRKPDERPSFFAQPGILAGKLHFGRLLCGTCGALALASSHLSRAINSHFRSRLKWPPPANHFLSLLFFTLRMSFALSTCETACPWTRMTSRPIYRHSHTCALTQRTA